MITNSQIEELENEFENLKSDVIAKAFTYKDEDGDLFLEKLSDCLSLHRSQMLEILR